MKPLQILFLLIERVIFFKRDICRWIFIKHCISPTRFSLFRYLGELLPPSVDLPVSMMPARRLKPAKILVRCFIRSVGTMYFYQILSAPFAIRCS
jgi:hypothetical protein